MQKKAINISSRESALWLGALAVFISGFLIFYGHQAARSGSWNYLIHSLDEYSYWAYAQGASESPQSDLNPFYFEERGKVHPVPYACATLTGFLAKWLRVPVLAFFPLWHVGMPFLTWLALYYCLTRFWGYPDRPAAAAALVLLLGTFFFRGQPPDILMRYSRPGDALWLLLIWLSLVMRPKEGKRFCLAAGAAAFAVMWLNPFLAVLGAAVTVWESAWQAVRERHFKIGRQCLWILLFLGAAGLSYFIYFKLHSSENLWVRLFKIRNRSADVYWASFILFPVITAMVWAAGRALREAPSAMDRLVLYVFMFEPLITVLDLCFPGIFQWMDKRYIYFLPQLGALTGWLADRTPALLRLPAFHKTEKWVIPSLGILTLAIFFHPRASFLRYGPGSVNASMVEDNSLLLLSALPAAVLMAWTYFRISRVRLFFAAPRRAAGAIALLAFAAYGGFARTCGDTPWNRDFPFDGAYRWLRQNAAENEVVLTVSPMRVYLDYLIFKTDQKSYITPQGDTVSRGPDNPDNIFRFALYTSLLKGTLAETQLAETQNLEDKLRRFRLDYVLLDSDGPFNERVNRQLEGFAREVYRDEKSVLLKLTTSPTGRRPG